MISFPRFMATKTQTHTKETHQGRRQYEIQKIALKITRTLCWECQEGQSQNKCNSAQKAIKGLTSIPVGTLSMDTNPAGQNRAPSQGSIQLLDGPRVKGPDKSFGAGTSALSAGITTMFPKYNFLPTAVKNQNKNYPLI